MEFYPDGKNIRRIVGYVWQPINQVRLVHNDYYDIWSLGERITDCLYDETFNPMFLGEEGFEVNMEDVTHVMQVKGPDGE